MKERLDADVAEEAPGTQKIRIHAEARPVKPLPEITLEEFPELHGLLVEAIEESRTGKTEGALNFLGTIPDLYIGGDLLSTGEDWGEQRAA